MTRRSGVLANTIDRVFTRLVGDTYTRWTVSDQARRAIVAYDKGRAGRKEAAAALEAGLGSARRLRRVSVRVFGCLPTGEPAGSPPARRPAARRLARAAISSALAERT